MRQDRGIRSSEPTTLFLGKHVGASLGRIVDGTCAKEIAPLVVHVVKPRGLSCAWRGEPCGRQLSTRERREPGDGEGGELYRQQMPTPRRRESGGGERGEPYCRHL